MSQKITKNNADGYISRLIEADPSNLKDLELLNHILELVCKDIPVKKISETLMNDFGSLAAICTAPSNMLVTGYGLPEKGADLLKTCHALAFNLINSGKQNFSKLAFTKENCIKSFMPYFIGKRRETMYLMLIDPSERILDIVKIAEGTSSRLIADNKHIIDIAVKYNATKVVVAHNHFTGPAPSSEDVVLTSKLVWLFGHMGIELCDHIIFFEEQYHSMLEAGELTSIGYNLAVSGKY